MQYVGARYVPKFAGTFDATQAYENMTVVDNGMGTSYISKIPVPAGSSLSDTNYWAIYGASNGAIINLQNQINAISLFKVIADTMSIADIQDIIANNDNVYFKPGTYNYDMTGENDAFIVARSGMNIWIDGDLILNPNPYEQGALIRVDQCDNVSIFGHGSLIGDKTTHLGSTGEWLHGVYITNSDNISVEGLTIKNSWGDGIYVGGGISASTHISIDKIISDGNRRNGISIVSASDVYLSNSQFINTSGTAPQSGIAIETNGTDGVMDNIHINNCHSENNGGSAGYASSHVDGSIYVKDCEFIGSSGNYGFTIATLDASSNTHFYIDDCLLAGINGLGITINLNSDVKSHGCVYKINAIPLQIFAPLNNSVITGIITDSTITEGIIWAVNNALTNDSFDFIINHTDITDVRRLSSFNNDNSKIIIETDDEPKTISSNGHELWSAPEWIYDDTSYAAGATQADLRYCVLRGIKYKIYNRSTHNYTVLLPTGTLKTNSFSGTLATGSALMIERLDSNTLLVTECS